MKTVNRFQDETDRQTDKNREKPPLNINYPVDDNLFVRTKRKTQ